MSDQEAEGTQAATLKGSRSYEEDEAAGSVDVPEIGQEEQA
ncbi:MAG TPA: hypothetical protein VK975_00260 [Acidimicrobiales bacterium]|nr:hypothetical protein [Acidimicrobiales bacterium]